MLDYTQSFEQFSQSVKPLDLALYAGAGLVLWVLFKDKLSPVQKFISDLVDSIKSKSTSGTLPLVPTVSVPNVVSKVNKDDIFFKLVSSWKQTRDLAVLSNCSEAVKVADQMFPFLSPNGCVEEKS